MSTPCRPALIAAMVLATCFLLLATDTAPAGLPERANLDGMVFVGRLPVVHTGTPLPERLEFSAGQFHSSASDSFGYTDGPYAARRVGDEILFDAFIESPALGWMVWRGRISAGELRGHARAKDPGTPETRFAVEAYAID